MGGAPADRRRGEIPVELCIVSYVAIQPSVFMPITFSLFAEREFTMNNSNKSNNGKMSGVAGQNPLEDTRTYSIQGKTFVVEPVFKEGAKETVGTVLLRLIQSDVEIP